MAGPSFSGPLSGWTASSLTPQSAVVSALPAPVIAPPPTGSSSDLSKYNLTDAELGVAPDLRKSKPQTTPLEDLLAAMFPDSAAEFEAQLDDPLANPRPTDKPSLLNTILGNLNSSGGPGSGGFVQNTGGPLVASVPTIPGAPAFLPGALNSLQNGFTAAPGVPAANANPLNSLGAVSAIAAEQRIQAAEQAKAKADAQATWFKSQQKMQNQAAKRAQIQKQKSGFSPVGGWTSPTFY